MADPEEPPPVTGPATSTTPPAMAAAARSRTTAARPGRRYAQPLPVRTFTLPAFDPSNPLSLVRLAVAWLGQVLAPPPAEPAVVHEGVWSAATRSVQVWDPKSMDGLWCQGFFGKGTLSRSEPNWLNREKARRGLLGETSEQRTRKRREARADTKWERGRAALEEIERRRQEEAEVEAAEVAAAAAAAAEVEAATARLPTTPPALPRAPVGPPELLALPNSEADLKEAMAARALHDPGCDERAEAQTSPADSSATASHDAAALGNGSTGTNGLAETPTAAGGNESRASGDTTPTEPLKRQKSVRFSATVESTTFQHTDPPSPSRASRALSPAGAGAAATEAAIENKECLQLSAEEAFFLVYAVGALTVRDPATGRALGTPQLLQLFRQHSYFPPRTLPQPQPQPLAPDDPFLVHYVVYHHFRSLGWVPRHGLKFGVDWLLYGKGPALDHAEFGVMVLPSYTDPRWEQDGADRPAPCKSWHWLHSANRVLTTVYKSLVLVYVDIPPPSAVPEGAAAGDVTALLRQYRIREVMVRRWTINRNRD